MRVLLNASYPGLHFLVKEEAKKYSQITHIATFKSNFLDSVVEVREILEKNHYDAIISRGGTAKILRDAFDVPVIDLEITQFEIFQALQMTNQYIGRRAIVGLHNVFERSHYVAEALGQNVAVFTVASESEVGGLLKLLQGQQFEMIIGDVVTVKYAREYGFNTFLVTSSEESVKRVLRRIVELTEGVSTYKRNFELLRETMTNEIKGVYLFLNGKMTNVLFEHEKLSGICHKLVERIDTSNVKKQAFRWNDQQYSLRKVLISENKNELLVTVQRIKNIGKMFRGISVGQLCFKSNPIYEIYYRLLNDEVFEESMNQFALKKEIVLIEGGKGLGEDYLARLLHERSSFREGLIYSIDVMEVSEMNFLSILYEEDSFFYQSGNTILLKNVDHLKLSLFQKLQRLVVETKIMNRNLVILIGHKIDVIYSQLIQVGMPPLVISPPELKHQQALLSNLVMLYINHLNQHQEKQVGGLKPSGLDVLNDYHWPGNLDEFESFLKQLAFTSRHFFITKAEIEKQFLQRKMSYQDKEIHQDRVTIDFKQGETFDEISKRIAQEMLKLHRGHKTETAESLGISRSTLWRLLK